jgi:hypothetical protein
MLILCYVVDLEQRCMSRRMALTIGASWLPRIRSCEFSYPDTVVLVGKRKAFQLDSEEGDRLEEILKQRAKKSR